jgi:hypothetical protein
MRPSSHINLLGVVSPVEQKAYKKESFLRRQAEKFLLLDANRWMQTCAQTLRDKRASVRAGITNQLLPFDPEREPEMSIHLLACFKDALEPNIIDDLKIYAADPRIRTVVVLTRTRMNFQEDWVHNITMPPPAEKRPSGIFVSGGEDPEESVIELHVRELDSFRRYDMNRLSNDILERAS